MSLRPDLTVAAVIEHDGQFLLVEERVGNAMVFNQPAGHVERGEELIAAVIRETLEETAWTFRPDALTGIYLWDQPEKQRSFLRFTFCGQVTSHDPHRRLDRGIERALWMSRAQIVMRSSRLRSPMVLRCIDDYLEGRRYPMEVVQHMLRTITTGGVDDRRARGDELPIIDRLS
ncbi:8-oxo-dGTP pyrophosphatase MutT (NUDIX family) [Povalibacter uvarum]|uniref:Phosphatase NudJ n=1 Tax=Povalibacter uvarum TaxID=732238 RepID=A0A841HJ62_9GAMM|nr:NUDIX hydrolase [Povalibacter uvarum]MBB6092192.1 8-oxo-dGTP pyrophosphatase MutT (NUDIX family) [Povalibacter uvarum]